MINPNIQNRVLFTVSTKSLFQLLLEGFINIFLNFKMHYHQFYPCTLPHHCHSLPFISWLLPWMWILQEGTGELLILQARELTMTPQVLQAPSPLRSKGSCSGAEVPQPIPCRVVSEVLNSRPLRKAQELVSCGILLFLKSLKTSWARGGFLLLDNPWWVFCSKNLDSGFGIQASFWHSAAQGQLFCSLIQKDLLLSVCLKPASH